jgi:hypothetical protein
VQGEEAALSEKQPPRISNRPRPSINYNNLASGNIDPNLIESKLPLRLNQSVWKRCLEYWSSVKESPQWACLQLYPNLQ